jgi:hypothetical protein
MVDPKETRFKAMSWDEKETVLEQSTQEVLRAREERIASESVEVVEAPQEATETTKFSQVTRYRIEISPRLRMHRREGNSCINRPNR